MTKAVLFRVVLSMGCAAMLSPAQVVKNYQPVTEQMLEKPNPNDWLMYSRTFDAQRFSPLKQINKQNVNQLRLAWERGLGAGQTETIPIVHNGVMYVVDPGAVVQALNAATGDLLWEYKRKVAGQRRRPGPHQESGDLSGPGDFRIPRRMPSSAWTRARVSCAGRAKTDGRGNTSGPFGGGRESDLRRSLRGQARELLHPGQRRAHRQGAVALLHHSGARASPATRAGAARRWRTGSRPPGDLPGSYDPVRKMLYWGVANPMPDQRMARHDGKADAVSRTAPSDLYSNSTIALDPATGKLAWYYQHLPADDWDSDYTHERTLLRTKVNPDPKFVKWINPGIKGLGARHRGDHRRSGRDVRAGPRPTGQFLWANPFPFDDPHNVISNIDVKTGKTEINWDNVFKAPGEEHVICYWNTRSYWPTAYSPVTNSLYTSYIDNCRDLTIAGPAGRGSWHVVQRPGGDPKALTGLAKINLSTGEILRFDVGRAPGNGAMLATAGDLVFHGDMSRRFRAFDAATGKMLWETDLGGNISVSTITYEAGGKQYVCVMTGDNLKVPELAAEVPELKTPRGHNAIYVFALP